MGSQFLVLRVFKQLKLKCIRKLRAYYELRVYPAGPPGEFVYFTRGSKRPGGPLSYQGVQNLSLFQPGGSQGVFFDAKPPFFGPPGHHGVRRAIFFDAKPTVFGSRGCPEPDRLFIFYQSLGVKSVFAIGS